MMPSPAAELRKMISVFGVGSCHLAIIRNRDLVAVTISNGHGLLIELCDGVLHVHALRKRSSLLHHNTTAALG